MIHNPSYYNIQYKKNKKIKKNKKEEEEEERFLAKKGVLSGEVLDLNTLCRDYSNHMTLVRLLYLVGDRSEKVCINYKV